MENIDVKTVDIDKYLEWLFSQNEMDESVNQFEKIKPNSVTWFPFTECGIKLVNEGRIKSFNEHVHRFNISIGGSPLPIFQLAKDEFEGIQEIYSPRFSLIQNWVMQGCIVYDWCELAEFCGYVDYLKYLISLNDTGKDQKSNIDNALCRLERMILFYYMIKADIVLSQRISQDDKRQSFIIGLLIGQSTDYKQYQDNNQMRKDWAKIQKEMANPSRSNTIATRKRLEKVRDTLVDYKDFNTIKSLIISDLEKMF